MKLGMSVLCAVSFIYFLYLGIIPITEGLQFIMIVSLIVAIVTPLSGMSESKFMEGNDADEEEPHHISNSIIMSRSNK